MEANPSGCNTPQETAAVDRASLLGLPAELIQNILSFLEPLDLASTSQACRELYTQSRDEQIWQSIVNSLLHDPVSTPGPAKSFRELYIAHRPHWFLVKKRIFFADSEPSGKLIMTRYDGKRGCIEAHTVVASRGPAYVSFWEKDPRVIIHSFVPQISLDTHRPALRLRYDAKFMENEYSSKGGSRYTKEVLMDAFAEPGLFSSFMLCRKLPESAIGHTTAVWPPLRFPVDSYTRNDSRDRFTSAGHRPTTSNEVSQNNFRIRKWVEFTGRRSSPGLSILGTGMPPHMLGNKSAEMTVRMPEDIPTFASLSEESYTPTAEKPYQGIWCGDYSAHGCEFLVITQPSPGHENPLPEGMDYLRHWFRSGRRDSAGSDDSFQSAVSHQSETNSYERDYVNAPTGRLEAIKITGDPNVPRGEYTFIAPEIGLGGFQRVADEEQFRGARVVRSAGHIAGNRFRNDQYIRTQLILVSPDTIGQYWEDFGHISFYRRVDLNALYSKQ